MALLLEHEREPPPSLTSFNVGEANGILKDLTDVYRNWSPSMTLAGNLNGQLISIIGQAPLRDLSSASDPKSTIGGPHELEYLPFQINAGSSSKSVETAELSFGTRLQQTIDLWNRAHALAQSSGYQNHTSESQVSRHYRERAVILTSVLIADIYHAPNTHHSNDMLTLVHRGLKVMLDVAYGTTKHTQEVERSWCNDLSTAVQLKEEARYSRRPVELAGSSVPGDLGSRRDTMRRDSFSDLWMKRDEAFTLTRQRAFDEIQASEARMAMMKNAGDAVIRRRHH